MNPNIILPISLYKYYSFFSQRIKVVAIVYMQLINSEKTISWYNRDVKLYLLKLDIQIFFSILIMNSTPLKEKKYELK
jgi:hypothetical protein